MIERAVISAASRILRDRAAIGSVLHEGRFSASDLAGALESVDAHILELESRGESATAISAVIKEWICTRTD
jgi:hypothetical protein